MKKYVLGILFCSCLLGTGIGCSEKAREEKIPETGKSGQNEITIMHVDADHPEFQKFIEQAEKELGLKIRIVSYPENTELKERPFSRNTMEDITSMGALFQRYVLEEISLEEFCKGAQNITDGF